jgi:hypothetical protein
MMMTTSTGESWTSFEETNANSGIEGIQCVLLSPTERRLPIRSLRGGNRLR